jgi:3-hydroxyisobutyrate dehydrogenase
MNIFTQKVGFIGLGKMGNPMCKRLARKNINLTVYDKEPNTSDQFKKIATIAPNLESLHDCDVVFTMLPDFRSTNEVLFSDRGLIRSLKKGSIIINSGTIGIAETRDIFMNLRNDFNFLDAPVSGGTQGAESGNLTFMVGGDFTIAKKVEILLKYMGNTISLLGDVGKGQAAKLCNNLLLAINMAGACEAFALAEKLGLDLKTFDQLVNVSSGRSWVTENNNPVPGINNCSPSTNNYMNGFSSGLLLKDIRLALKAIPNDCLKLPMLKQAELAYSKMISTDEDSKFKDMSYLIQHISTANKTP